MSTSYVLIVFALVIVLMIVLISKCKVNAAMGILLSAFILAIALGKMAGALVQFCLFSQSGDSDRGEAEQERCQPGFRDRVKGEKKHGSR